MLFRAASSSTVSAAACGRRSPLGPRPLGRVVLFPGPRRIETLGHEAPHPAPRPPWLQLPAPLLRGGSHGLLRCAAQVAARGRRDRLRLHHVPARDRASESRSNSAAFCSRFSWASRASSARGSSNRPMASPALIRPPGVVTAVVAMPSIGARITATRAFMTASRLALTTNC